MMINKKNYMNHEKIMSRSLWWLRQCLQRALASNFATTVEEDEKLLAFAPFKAIQVCVLRCVAVCSGVLPCVAVCSRVLPCVAVCCRVLHHLLSLKLIRCVQSYGVATISRLLKIIGLFCRI